MPFSWIRKPALLGLGLTATMAAGLVGCGETTADKDVAVVVPDPTAVVPAKPPAPKAKPAGEATGVAPTAAPGHASAAEPVKAEGWGTLQGRVTFEGTPPLAANAVITVDKNPEVCGKDRPITAEKLVVNPGNKGVKNAFVYLQRPGRVKEEARKAALAHHPVFDQKNCTYVPHALAIMTGETVTVKSSDATNHNVNFRLKKFPQNQMINPFATMEFTPEFPEIAPGPVNCDIHSWMLAYWLVLDHPYFAVTDENGHYEIKDAPAGTQKVVVWQESTAYVTPAAGEPVNLEPNATTEQDFKIDAAKIH